MKPDYDPCLPDWRDDPYPHYRALRDAGAGALGAEDRAPGACRATTT